MIREQVQEVRAAALAGKFYPGEREFLAKVTTAFLGQHAGETPDGLAKAVISPHSGFVYSGAVAGHALASWADDGENIERVVIIGPSHHFDFPGLAVPGAAAFETPLGRMPVDEAWLERLDRYSYARVFAAAHEQEHTIEVQLPFLQTISKELKIVPLITGRGSDLQVAQVLDQLWGGPETRIVISSDLSHFLDYASAQKMDQHTAHLIENFEYRKLSAEQACGCRAIRGFLRAALERELKCRNVDLRNSGDTAGVATEIIGYGAFQFFEG